MKAKMTEDIPITDPTISQVLETFLRNQSKSLKPSTIRKYRDVIELLKDCLDGYAYTGLDEEDSKLLDQSYNKGIEFCDVFGPEKILPEIDEFLGYFMIRKVAAGNEQLKSAGTVTKKLAKWLHANGFVDAVDAEFAIETGSKAAKVLPKAEDLSDILYGLKEHISPDELIEEVDDQFTIAEVRSGGVMLSALLDRRKFFIRLPSEVVDQWVKSWTASLKLGRTKDGWHIIGVGNVYPM